MKREANLHFAQDFAAHATRRLGNFRNLEERVPWVLGSQNHRTSLRGVCPGIPVSRRALQSGVDCLSLASRLGSSRPPSMLLRLC